MSSLKWVVFTLFLCWGRLSGGIGVFSFRHGNNFFLHTHLSPPMRFAFFTFYLTIQFKRKSRHHYWSVQRNRYELTSDNASSFRT